MVEASWKVHVTVGLLSLTDAGVRHSREALMDLKNASWRTSATNYRSELVMVTPILVKLTSYWMILAGHFTLQMMLVPSLFGLIQTPLAPFPGVLE